MFKKTVLAIALSACAFSAIAAESQPVKTAKLSIVSTDSKECQQVITSQVSKGLLEKIIQAVPKDKKDNVYQAVKESNAEKMNKEKVTDINTDVSVSIYSTAEQIWTKMLDKAIEVAKETVDTLITTMYNNAIDRVVSMANNATSRLLNKVTDKLGGQVGYVVSSALSQIVPDATNLLGHCAKQLDVDCLSKVQNVLNSSISNGLNRGIGAAQDSISGAIGSRMSDAYYGKINQLGGLSNEAANAVYGMTSEIFYTTKSIATEAVYKFDRRSAAEAVSSIGGEPLIQLYGQGK